VLPWALEDLNEQRLAEIVANGREEGQTLEYKRSMSFESSEDKLKVLKAVSAFANTFGGDLVIGVDAPEGVPTSSSIVGVSITEIDRFKLAFESFARDSLEPSLPAGAVNFKSVPIGRDSARAVLVVRVTQSWLGPHRIGKKGNREFWTRTSAGKEPMTIWQLRDAFMLSGAAREKVREFVTRRLDDITPGGGRPDTPIALANDMPKFVLHVIPIASFAHHDVRIDVVRYRQNSEKLRPISTFRNWETALNLDGVVAFRGTKYPTVGYTQLYREGMIEAVQCIPAQVLAGSSPPEREMYVGYFESEMREALSRYLSLLSDEEIGAPISLYLTLLDASNCRLSYTEMNYGRSPRMVGSNVATLPEVLIHDAAAGEVDKQLKILFDALWNCGDVPASPSFDDAGLWCGHQFQT
jgi:Putative DNA-binding domain